MAQADAIRSARVQLQSGLDFAARVESRARRAGDQFGAELAHRAAIQIEGALATLERADVDAVFGCENEEHGHREPFRGTKDEVMAHLQEFENGGDSA